MKRQPGETFEAYKQRRAAENEKVRIALLPRHIWIPNVFKDGKKLIIQGTYRRKGAEENVGK